MLYIRHNSKKSIHLLNIRIEVDSGLMFIHNIMSLHLEKKITLITYWTN